MSIEGAKDSLRGLDKVLQQFKAPEFFDSEFNKLQEAIDNALSALDGLAPSSTQSLIASTIADTFDAAFDPTFVEQDGENLRFNLPLNTNFGVGLPELQATIDSVFLLDDPTPELSFKVELETGSFVQDFTKPVLGEVEKVVKPLEAIYNVLNTNLPGLDDIGIKISFLSIAELYDGGKASEFVEFLKTVGQVSSLISQVNSLTDNNVIELGRFTLGSSGISSSTPQVDLINQLDSGFSSFLNDARNSIGMTFPLLESPSTAFELLLGNDINLLDVSIQSVPAFSFIYSSPPIIIPIPPIPIPLVGQFSGGVTLGTSELKFGFDTTGLRENNPLQGLFISGQNPIFTVTPQLSASLRAEAGIGAGGVEISVEGDVNFYLPGKPDKFRPAEFGNLPNFTVEGDSIDLVGSIFGRIGPPVSFFSKKFSRELFRVTLFDFGNSSSGSNPRPDLATYDSEARTLRLNMGSEADRNKRKINEGEINEEFSITGDNNNLIVSAFNLQEDFNNLDVVKIIAFADTGDDKIFVDTNVAAELYGGLGNDILGGGSNADRLQGENDDDQLSGNAGDDLLYGDQGNDELSGGDGIDYLWGSEGIDILDGGLQGDFLYAGEGDDILIGGSSFQDAQGNTFRDGDDFLDGGEGNDLLVGEAGSDTLYGEIGDDEIYGGDDIDSLYGQAGDDRLYGESGDDTLVGDEGNDRISGGDGIDKISYINSTSGIIVNLDEENSYESYENVAGLETQFQVLAGTAADGFGTTDYFKFTVAQPVFNNSQEIIGQQEVAVAGNLENIDGSIYDDIFIGNALDNIIEGINGNDLFISNAGNDTLNGGGENDTVSYHRDLSAVSINLAIGRGSDGFGNTDTLNDIENVVGSALDDSIIGNAVANIITAGDGGDTIEAGIGDDQLYGEAGIDLLVGKAGNDQIDGGSEVDTASYEKSPKQVVVNIDESNAYATQDSFEPSFTIAPGKALDGFNTEDTVKNLENIIGSGFDDVLIGNSQNNIIQGLAGKDLFVGNAGDDNLEGGEDTDTVSYRRDPAAVKVDLAQNKAKDGFAGNDQLFEIENILGSRFNDELLGNAVDNLIAAGTGVDTLKGDAGNDQLLGESENDFLMGQAGNDEIDGGSESDTVSYEDSPAGVVVNIDEAQDYQNPGGILHQSIFFTAPIPTDTEPSFSIDAGKAQDGFGTLDTLKNLENIKGSASADMLISNALNNQIEGLASNDVLVGNAGNDTLDGGDGSDTASYRRDPGSVRINLAQNEAKDGFGNTDRLISIENAVGSALDDEIIGNAKSNIIHAGAGNDTVKTDAGNDILFGEVGQDQLFGEADDDFLVGGADSDLLDGGDGIDTASYLTATSGIGISLIANSGWLGEATGDQLRSIENLEGSEYADRMIGNNTNNVLSGLGGNDFLDGRAGDDWIDGGSGNDIEFGDDGNDQLYGQAGNDDLDGGSGDDQLFGGEGDDSIVAKTGNDRLEAGEGNDTGRGGGGKDVLLGQAGDDNLDGEGDDDQIFGDEGDDFLYGRTGDDVLDGGNGNDNALCGDGDDQIFGQEGDDNLIGEAGNDQIIAGSGNDILYGNEGNDQLTGGEGIDYFEGGGGTDTAIYTNSIIGVTVDLITGRGQGGEAEGDLLLEIEHLKGSTGNDLLSGSALKNHLEANDGADRLVGLAGDDILIGGKGDDQLNGGKGRDQLTADAGNDRLKGNGGKDLLTGGEGNDQLIAGGGNDTLTSDNGADVLNGGKGQDTASYITSTTGITVSLKQKKGFRGDASGDRLRLIEHVEGSNASDRLTGNFKNNKLQGWHGNDLLKGKGGRDILTGGEGADILTGGADADKFVFDSLKGGTDTITDFSTEDGDRMIISARSSGKNLTIGTLSADQFVLGSAARDTNDRFIYNSSTGKLFFDADGEGGIGQIQFAKLSKGLSLTHQEFRVR